MKSKCLSSFADDSSDWRSCQFCPLMFSTTYELKSHTFGHFSTRKCSDCNVHLIQICDEWFELHTIANCQNNNRLDTFSANHNENYGQFDESLVIKQEVAAEVSPEHLDELLNVKLDVDLNDFDGIFASNLSTDIITNDNNAFSDASQLNIDEMNGDLLQNSNSQYAFRIVSVKELTGPPNTAKTNPANKGFQCRFCDKILRSRFRLDCHLQSYHNPSNQTNCKHCERSFNTFERLDKHMRRCKFNNKKRTYMRSHPHRPIENFICDICGSTLKKVQICKFFKKNSF